MKKLYEDDLDKEIIARLLIFEQLHGEDVEVTLDKPSIISEDKNVAIDVKGESSGDIKKFIETSAVALFQRHPEVKSATLGLKKIIVDKSPYIFNQNTLALDSMSVTYDDDNTQKVGHAFMPDIAHLFQFMETPVIQPPACLIQALLRGNKDGAKEICQRINQRVSLYADHGYEPTYFAEPGTFKTTDEEELKWTIS